MRNRSYTPFMVMAALAFFITTGCRAQEKSSEPYQSFRAPNSIVIDYAVYLPDGYEPDRTYPAVLAFPPGAMGRVEADALTEHLWNTPPSRGNWIVVVPLVPGEDWRTHPNHHALEDLLDHLMDQYQIRGDTFHLLGYGSMGARIASTWSSMSRKYFSTFTAVSDMPYRTWDDRDLSTLASRERNRSERLDLLAIFTGEDQVTTSDIEAARGRLDQKGIPYAVEVVAGNKEAEEALANGRLLKIMAAQFGKN